MESSTGGWSEVGDRSAFVSKTADVSVKASKKATGGVGIMPNGKPAIEVGIPGAQRAREGRAVLEGVMVYADTARSSSTAVQVAIGGSTRFLSIISGPDAPSRYEFPITFPGRDRGELVMTPNGGVDILGVTGDLVAGIEPPWAFDANLNAVDTHYTLEGDTVVLNVDHQHAVYPVVADPNVDTSCGYVSCTVYFLALRPMRLR